VTGETTPAAQSISVVVVTWNNLDMIGPCLDSIHSQTLVPAQVIVVDNGSQDGTTEWLRKRPDVELVANRFNRGFAAANNQGIRRADGDQLLLVNADVELEPDYIERCAAHFEDASVGSVTGKLLRPGAARRLDSAGHAVYGLGWAENRGEELPDAGYDRPEEVFGVCAAAALYRRAALESVIVEGELLDESYFAYIEDIDLDWRLRWMGWRAWYEPAAVAIHHRSATGARFSTPIMRHILKNRILTVVKDYDGRMLARNAPGILAFTVTKTIDFARSNPGAVLGLVDAARLMPRALRWRRILRERRVAEPASVARWLRPFPWAERARRRLGRA
jgi:GT2 family glycosyltransferase